MFGVLIAVHELGHFSAAKLFGIKVNEYSVGMGPTIFKKKKGEYQLLLSYIVDDIFNIYNIFL